MVVVSCIHSLKGDTCMQAAHYEVSSALELRIDLSRQMSTATKYLAVTRSGETVYLVEGDSQVRKSLSDLLESSQIKVISFGTVPEYLAYARPNEPSCLVIELDLPGLSMTDLQQWNSGVTSPSLVFISGHADVAAAVRVMKAGAIEVLTKPVDPIALISAVRAALAEDRKLRQRKAELARLQERFSLLTPRERDVLPLVLGGLLNKQAAFLLGISEVTLQLHRSRAMRKMQAESFADLVRMSVKLRIRHWRENEPSHTQRAT
jgi:FixJ family two-component response regulator